MKNIFKKLFKNDTQSPWNLASRIEKALFSATVEINKGNTVTAMRLNADAVEAFYALINLHKDAKGAERSAAKAALRSINIMMFDVPKSIWETIEAELNLCLYGFTRSGRR